MDKRLGNQKKWKCSVSEEDHRTGRETGVSIELRGEMIEITSTRHGEEGRALVDLDNATLVRRLILEAEERGKSRRDFRIAHER